MKKHILILIVLCVILSGCGNCQKSETEASISISETETTETIPSVADSDNQDESASESASTVYPLPDYTMDTIDNAVFAISLNEGDAYVDDTGIMQMKVTVYSYDVYDMVDIAGLKPGDIIVTHFGEIAVDSIEQNEFGTILINGGLEEEGIELFSDDNGVYYEIGFNDTKNWYEVGVVTLRV